MVAHAAMLLTECKGVNLTTSRVRKIEPPDCVSGMVKIDPVKVGRRLAALRKAENGMTQAALAARLGVSNGAVALWETGDREIRYAHMERICAVFRIMPDVLLTGDLDSVTGRRRAVLLDYWADIGVED